MPLFFRSDTRPLEIIKKAGGFKPKEDFGEGWWKVAIRADTPLRFMERKKADDALKAACVSLSTRFESTLLFPDSSASADDVHVYIIALPPATKIEYQENSELILSDESNAPSQIKKKIIDLHSLQTTQVGKIIDAEEPRSIAKKYAYKSVNAYSAWSLYAYEAIAYEIPIENIIGVIKVHRGFEKIVGIFDNWQFNKMLTPKRKFKIDDEFILNESFKSKQTYLAGNPNNLQLITQDYDEEVQSALKIINELKNKDNLKTPTVYHGLGGKTF